MDWLVGPPDHWSWFILGGLLLILEMFAPGVVFLWLAIAAGLVGLALLLMPGLAWQFQFLLFAAASIAGVFAARRYLRGAPPVTDQPALNRRGDRYIGRTVTLTEPIVNGRGRAGVDDTNWPVEGPDLPVGTAVRVTGVDGTILRVERQRAASPPNSTSSPSN